MTSDMAQSTVVTGGQNRRATIRVRTRRVARPVASMLATVGDMTRFSASVIASVPLALRDYFSEIIRQAGIVILSSSLIIWSFAFVMGLEGSLFGSYLLESLGAADYIGLFLAVAGVQGFSAPTFSWMFAAKVGCGYAAELGTMRITEEIDALHVMGLNPRAYLAATRLLAFWIAAPFMWLMATGAMMMGFWLMAVPLLNTASPGGYSDIFWSFQTPIGLIYAMIWAFVTGTLIVLVSCYFGYNASGGPVGVGRATAKSMLVNMLLVSICTGFFYQVFFGINVDYPIGN